MTHKRIIAAIVVIIPVVIAPLAAAPHPITAGNKERCKGCNVLEGFSVQGGRERDGILFVMKGDKEVNVRSQVHTWLQRVVR